MTSSNDRPSPQRRRIIGLGIAVVCMISHVILHQRAKTIQHDLDATQERVFNLLTIQTRPGGY